MYCASLSAKRFGKRLVLRQLPVDESLTISWPKRRWAQTSVCQTGKYVKAATNGGEEDRPARHGWSATRARLNGESGRERRGRVGSVAGWPKSSVLSVHGTSGAGVRGRLRAHDDQPRLAGPPPGLSGDVLSSTTVHSPGGSCGEIRSQARRRSPRDDQRVEVVALDEGAPLGRRRIERRQIDLGWPHEAFGAAVPENLIARRQPPQQVVAPPVRQGKDAPRRCSGSCSAAAPPDGTAAIGPMRRSVDSGPADGPAAAGDS